MPKHEDFCGRGRFFPLFFPGITTDRGIGRRCNLSAQEAADDLRHFARLFEMRQVSGIVDRLDAGIGNPLRKVLGVI